MLYRREATDTSLKVFVARWIGLPIHQGQLFTVDVGGVSLNSGQKCDRTLTVIL